MHNVKLYDLLANDNSVYKIKRSEYCVSVTRIGKRKVCPLIFFRFLFYQYMAVFLFNTVIYVFLLKKSMYSFCCLCTCILIVRPCILNVVYVCLLLSIYSYCLCIHTVRPCILIVVYVYLLLPMYS